MGSLLLSGRTRNAACPLSYGKKFVGGVKVAEKDGMDVSLMLSLLLGLPEVVLAALKIIDWCRKSRDSNLADNYGEVSPRKIEEPSASAAPADQAIAPLIRQAELAVEVERLIADELRHCDEARHRH